MRFLSEGLLGFSKAFLRSNAGTPGLGHTVGPLLLLPKDASQSVLQAEVLAGHWKWPKSWVWGMVCAVSLRYSSLPFRHGDA